MKPTDLTGLYPDPVPDYDRLSWRDKIVLNALGLVGIVLIVVLVCGVIFIWNFAKGFL